MGEIRIVGPGKTRGYPYPVYKKSYCTTPDISTAFGGSISKMLKVLHLRFYVMGKTHCQVSYPVCGQVFLPYKFYVLGQKVSANSADQDQTASEEAV